MSSVGREGRSFLTIRPADLRRLASIARADRAGFFERRADWATHYAGRFLGAALCQGAALHFLHGEAGINDFDLYTFFAANPRRRWCARRIKTYDFGNDRFGRSADNPQFVGRRVDVMGRALSVRVGANPVDAISAYIRRGRTVTARMLREKAVILIEPDWLLGTVAWPAAERPAVK